MRLLTILLALALLASPVSAVVINLDSYNVTNPKILVNYTIDVDLFDSDLISLDPDNPNEYILTHMPVSPDFDDHYVLTTEDADGPLAVDPGPYQLTLRARDTQGSETLDVINFEITGLDIVLLDPPFGISTETPFDVIFATYLDNNGVLTETDSTCSYSNVGWDSGMTDIEGLSSSHVIEGVYWNGYLYIICEETSGRETSKRFEVGYDNTEPEFISLTATPSLVVDTRDKSSFIVAEMNEETYCEIDGDDFDDDSFPGESKADQSSYSERHEVRAFYNDITDTIPRTFTYTVECWNLAGLSAKSTVSVTVDLSQFIFIDVLAPSSPTNQSTFDLIVKPTFQADSCTVNGGSMGEDGDTFVATFTNVQDGMSIYDIFCSGENETSREYELVVDTEDPEIDELEIPNPICGEFVVDWNASDNEGILSYTYNIYEGEDLIESEDTVQSSASIYLLSGSFEFEIYATDIAKNEGPVKSESFEVLDSSDPICEDIAEEQHCDNDILDGDEEGIDCGGSCVSCIECIFTSDCPLTMSCDGLICIPEPDDDPQDPIDPADDPDGGVDTPPLAGNECTSDFECEFDEECRSGSCVPIPDTNNPTPILPDSDPLPEAKGFNWLALVLIILGVLVMGGSGYYLYEEHETKKFRSSKPIPFQPQGRPGGPPPRAPPGSPRAPGGAAQRPVQKTVQQPPQKIPGAKDQRHQMMEAFGETKESPKNKKSSPKKSKKKKGEDSIFDELEKL